MSTLVAPRPTVKPQSVRKAAPLAPAAPVADEFGSTPWSFYYFMGVMLLGLIYVVGMPFFL